jgi:hypothetical protein
MVMFGLFRSSPKPSAAAIARKVESARSCSAARKKADQERHDALERAKLLGRVSEPMTPRAQIAAEVAAERAKRKKSKGRGKP